MLGALSWGTTMANDRMKYLEWHGSKLRVRVKVPKAARAVLGKGKLTYPLHTDSLTEANRLKEFHVLRLKATIKAALLPDAFRPDDLTVEAMRVREAVAAERDGPPKVDYDNPLAPGQGVIVTDEADWAVERAEAIADKHGKAAAHRFHNLASGKVLPLALNLETWLLQINHAGRTKRDYRVAVRDLRRWLGKHDIEETVQAATRQLAARYITESLIPGHAVRTVNKAISSLSAYWKWLVRRGDAVDNPWAGQLLPKPKQHRQGEGIRKRPFTDDEVAKLLSGPADKMLADLMCIAALSGMRIEEICSLRLADCADDLFTIAFAKTPAGQRQVPIHSVLQPIVAARCEGKGRGDLLFHELPPVAPSRQDDNRLSDPATKAFTRYRRACGVDEVERGAKQSNIDFHSFRRWFAARAHRALQEGVTGFTPWTVADVIGHDRKALPLGMTFGTYAGPSEFAARRACIEAVKLPALPAGLTRPRERKGISRVRRKNAAGSQ